MNVLQGPYIRLSNSLAEFVQVIKFYGHEHGSRFCRFRMERFCEGNERIGIFMLSSNTNFSCVPPLLSRARGTYIHWIGRCELFNISRGVIFV